MNREMTNVSHADATAQEEYDFHCITCSDEALPARVLSVDQATGMARVAIGSAEEEIDVSLVDAIAPGATVLVHGGVALSIVEDQDRLERGSEQ